MPSNKFNKRCAWVGETALMIHYHDHEWGCPSYEDRHLFEMLILEGAQAGLSWQTVLQRRADYQKAFYNFDPHAVARMNDGELHNLHTHGAIIRNRLKIHSTRRNAQIVLDIQKERGSFSNYLWEFVNHQPLVNSWACSDQLPTQSKESCALSKDLKRRGMSFVGPTIMYAFMQAVGMVNDHTDNCFLKTSSQLKI